MSSTVNRFALYNVQEEKEVFSFFISGYIDQTISDVIGVPKVRR